MVVPLKRMVAALLVLLATFCAIFFASLHALQTTGTVFGLGLPPDVENVMVMILSVIGVILVVYEIFTIERKLIR